MTEREAMDVLRQYALPEVFSEVARALKLPGDESSLRLRQQLFKFENKVSQSHVERRQNHGREISVSVRFSTPGALPDNSVPTPQEKYASLANALHVVWEAGVNMGESCVFVYSHEIRTAADPGPSKYPDLFDSEVPLVACHHRFRCAAREMMMRGGSFPSRAARRRTTVLPCAHPIERALRSWQAS